MTNRNAGGKGSARRSSQVSMETVDANFDRIFGKKKADSKNAIPGQQSYFTDYIYVAQYPDTKASIKRVPAGTKIPKLAISGATFAICKEGMRVVAETRVKRLEQELINANKHLKAVLALKESDIT